MSWCWHVPRSSPVTWPGTFQVGPFVLCWVAHQPLRDEAGTRCPKRDLDMVHALKSSEVNLSLRFHCWRNILRTSWVVSGMSSSQQQPPRFSVSAGVNACAAAPAAALPGRARSQQQLQNTERHKSRSPLGKTIILPVHSRYWSCHKLLKHL